MRCFAAEIFLFLAVACHPTPAATPTPTGSAEPVALTVRNHHWADVRVYAIHGGVRERLGLVPAASSRRFELPSRILSAGASIRLEASPVGGAHGFTSENILVRPGQVVTWTLETELARSTVMVQ
jgi:hypothetical protein